MTMKINEVTSERVATAFCIYHQGLFSYSCYNVLLNVSLAQISHKLLMQGLVCGINLEGMFWVRFKLYRQHLRCLLQISTENFVVFLKTNKMHFSLQNKRAKKKQRTENILLKLCYLNVVNFISSFQHLRNCSSSYVLKTIFVAGFSFTVSKQSLLLLLCGSC